MMKCRECSSEAIFFCKDCNCCYCEKHRTNFHSEPAFSLHEIVEIKPDEGELPEDCDEGMSFKIFIISNPDGQERPFERITDSKLIKLSNPKLSVVGHPFLEGFYSVELPERLSELLDFYLVSTETDSTIKRLSFESFRLSTKSENSQHLRFRVKYFGNRYLDFDSRFVCPKSRERFLKFLDIAKAAHRKIPIVIKDRNLEDYQEMTIFELLDRDPEIYYQFDDMKLLVEVDEMDTISILASKDRLYVCTDGCRKQIDKWRTDFVRFRRLKVPPNSFYMYTKSRIYKVNLPKDKAYSLFKMFYNLILKKSFDKVGFYKPAVAGEREYIPLVWSAFDASGGRMSIRVDRGVKLAPKSINIQSDVSRPVNMSEDSGPPPIKIRYTYPEDDTLLMNGEMTCIDGMFIMDFLDNIVINQYHDGTIYDPREDAVDRSKTLFTVSAINQKIFALFMNSIMYKYPKKFISGNTKRVVESKLSNVKRDPLKKLLTGEKAILLIPHNPSDFALLMGIPLKDIAKRQKKFKFRVINPDLYALKKKRRRLSTFKVLGDMERRSENVVFGTMEFVETSNVVFTFQKADGDEVRLSVDVMDIAFVLGDDQKTNVIAFKNTDYERTETLSTVKLWVKMLEERDEIEMLNEDSFETLVILLKSPGESMLVVETHRRILHALEIQTQTIGPEKKARNESSIDSDDETIFELDGVNFFEMDGTRDPFMGSIRITTDFVKIQAGTVILRDQICSVQFTSSKKSGIVVGRWKFLLTNTRLFCSLTQAQADSIKSTLLSVCQEKTFEYTVEIKMLKIDSSILTDHQDEQCILTLDYSRIALHSIDGQDVFFISSIRNSKIFQKKGNPRIIRFVLQKNTEVVVRVLSPDFRYGILKLVFLTFSAAPGNGARRAVSHHSAISGDAVDDASGKMSGNETLSKTRPVENKLEDGTTTSVITGGTHKSAITNKNSTEVSDVGLSSVRVDDSVEDTTSKQVPETESIILDAIRDIVPGGSAAEEEDVTTLYSNSSSTEHIEITEFNPDYEEDLESDQ